MFLDIGGLPRIIEPSYPNHTTISNLYSQQKDDCLPNVRNFLPCVVWSVLRNLSQFRLEFIMHDKDREFGTEGVTLCFGNV